MEVKLLLELPQLLLAEYSLLEIQFVGLDVCGLINEALASCDEIARVDDLFVGTLTIAVAVLDYLQLIGQSLQKAIVDLGKLQSLAAPLVFELDDQWLVNLIK